MSTTIRRIILLALMLVAVLVTASKEEDDVEDYDCFTDTIDIVLAQLNGQKEIIICPHSTITFGFPTDQSFTEFVGGQLPVVVLGPDVTIKCGRSGKPENNCIFKGGAFQIASLPQLPFGGDVITVDSISNLHVQGITFTGEQVALSDFYFTVTVGLGVDGNNIVFEDNIWTDLTTDSALDPTTSQGTWDITLRNNVFQNVRYTYNLLDFIEATEAVVESNVFDDIRPRTMIPEDQLEPDGTFPFFAQAFRCYGAVCVIKDNCFQDVEYGTPGLIVTNASGIVLFEDNSLSRKGGGLSSTPEVGSLRPFRAGTCPDPETSICVDDTVGDSTCEECLPLPHFDSVYSCGQERARTSTSKKGSKKDSKKGKKKSKKGSKKGSKKKSKYY